MSGNDVVRGGAGDDYSTASADTIEGGDGNDVLRAGGSDAGFLDGGARGCGAGGFAAAGANVRFGS